MPFQSPAPFESLVGTLIRQSNRLAISFQIPKTSALIWPAKAIQPERRSGLWQSTCFECFIGLSDSSAYLECNLSPSGDWQAFRFDDYRQPPQAISSFVEVNSIVVSSLTETNVTSTSISGSVQSDSAQECVGLQCIIDIHDPAFVTQDWQISPTCVLEDGKGLHYYACQHPIGRPDFHLSDQRQLSLTTQTPSLT